MTKAGKLEIKLNAFMKQVEERLSALESAKKQVVDKPKKSKKDEIILEIKNDDIVASDAE